MIDPEFLFNNGVAIGVCLYFMIHNSKSMDKFTQAVNNNTAIISELKGIINKCKKD